MAKLINYFKVVTPQSLGVNMTDNQSVGDHNSYSNFTWYQRLVQGSGTRIIRYREYDLMDNDIEIARSLDTIAEEMIGSNPSTSLPLQLVIENEKTQQVQSSTVLTLRTALRYWNQLHDFNTRLFKIARIAIKYGDCFFIRHSDTKKWEHVHPKHVVGAIVDENDMTKILGWQIRRDIKAPAGAGSKNNQDVETFSVNNVVWFSLNDDIGETAPFGESVLRAVYRAHKQKELLEDAIIIYRIQRAPERRVFYIDVGKMPPQRVKSYLENIKNEIRQRKIPTFGGGQEQVDSVYNPQQMSEDFFFAQRPDGRGSKVETLPGGQGLGELADLEYFQWKVFRGLRIPLSFMREGTDNATLSDGKTGMAYIQELRFAMYIKRLQGYLENILDKEFKRYLRAAEINVDHNMFSVKLNDPENFGIYRQQQLDNELLNTFNAASNIEHLSKRFSQKKYLQLTDEEILLNFRQKCEELGLDPDSKNNQSLMTAVYGSTIGGTDAGLGMNTGMFADSTSGIQNFESPQLPIPSGDSPVIT